MIRIPDGHIIVPESIETLNSVVSTEVAIKKGLAKAVTTPELFLPYNGGLVKANDSGELKNLGDPKKRVNRDFDAALQQRINWAIEHGYINKGAFDDRKLRFDGFTYTDTLTGKLLEFRFGPSHFLEHLSTNHQGMLDGAMYGRLTAKGQRNFKDERAYFADNLAENVVLKASDGRYVLGLRSPKQRFWPGRWHNIGGFYVPRFELFEADDQGRSVLESFADLMYAELNEEAAIERKDVKHLRLIGVSYGMSSVDLNYDSEVEADSEYISTKGHFKAKDADEHTGLIGVSFSDLCDVLAGKKLLDLKAEGGVIPCPEKAGPSKFVPIGLAGLLVHVGLQDPDRLKYILDQSQYKLLA